MKDVSSSGLPFVNEDSFHKFFNSLVEGVLLVNSNGEILIANQSAEEMFGYKEDELSGLWIERLVPFGDPEKHSAYRQKYFENPTPRKMGEGRDLNGLRKDGAIFPVEISLSPMRGDINDFVVTFITDISKRKVIEKKLTEEKEMARLYFDAAEVMLLVLNGQGEIIEINQKGCEILGFSEKELIGTKWFDYFIKEEDKPHIEEVFKSIIEDSNKYQRFDNLVLTKSGEEKSIHWQNTILRDSDGQIVGTLISGTDLTEKNKIMGDLRESRKKLEHYSAGLEKEVGLRTKELNKAVKRLKRSQDELKESLSKEKDLNELKSKFVSLASHEFRTPLSTILSSASLITKYPGYEENEKRLKHVKRIKTSVTHMNGILEDFLSVDKLDEGRIECHPEEFDAIELVEEVVESLIEILKPGQTLDYTCEDSAKAVVIDKKLLRNILINVTSNAIKYSPENKPIAIKVSFKKSRLYIDIEDQGIGIPEEDQKNMFSPFFRASNTHNIQGTGLGLNIVKRYVELMKGKIGFVSSCEKGTTIKIDLPVEV